LQTEVGPLSEDAAECLLADEGDHARAQVAGDALQAVGRAGEVPAAEVAGAGRRPVGGVRDADAQGGQLVLLLRSEQARREAGVVEEPPEVVARIRKVRTGGGGEAPRVDTAEDDGEIRGKDVRQRARAGAGVGALS
jgi:hypothetical protein